MKALSQNAAASGASQPISSTVCWCVTDGRPGMENQAVGLAEAMGFAPVVKRVLLKPLWRLASPHITAFKRYAMSSKGDMLAAPWPDILIATGRPSILPALHIKGQSGGRTFAIQLQDPVSLRYRFDRIVVPEHDGLQGANVIRMDGALHRVTPATLAEARAKWAPRFGGLRKPLVAVLLGGNNSRYVFGKREAAMLGLQLKALSGAGFGLMITPSRRTGEANMAILREALTDTLAFIWDETGDNPYFGMMAHADAFVVTCDSVNMVSEACSTGRPVHFVELPGENGKALPENDKFMRFRRGFERHGRIRVFQGRIENWTYEPLREMERVAGLIRETYFEYRGSVAREMALG